MTEVSASAELLEHHAKVHIETYGCDDTVDPFIAVDVVQNIAYIICSDCNRALYSMQPNGDFPILDFLLEEMGMIIVEEDDE